LLAVSSLFPNLLIR